MTTTPADLSPAKRLLLERRLRRPVERERRAIDRRPPDEVTALSFAQERLWFMEQLAPDTGAYTIPVALRLRGELDEPALRRALTAVVAGHESLRMRFPTTEDGVPEVRVEPAPDELPLEVVDAAGEERAFEVARALAGRGFDLQRGPLLRAHLVRLASADHLLVLSAHHIVSDGWSTPILIREVMAAYRGQRPAGLPVQYGDYARWQRERLAGPALDADRAYWRSQLADLPALELPTDRPRPATQTFAGATHGFWLDAELTAAVAELGREHGATLYMTLLAGYHTLLGWYAGQHDFAIGASVAGRTRPELEGLIGMFVNMLAIRPGLAGDPPFLELLAHTRRTVLDALAYQELPFEHLVNDLGVERDPSRSPLFQATFAVLNYEMGLTDNDAPGLSVAWEPLELPATRFDLDLQAVEIEGALRCRFIYSSALFDEPTVAGMAADLESLLRAAVARPEARLSELTRLDGPRRALVVDDWNATDAPFPDAATLHGLIEEQVARTPGAPAVEFEGGTLTFSELNALANRIAHRLRGLGVGRETLVGVCAERSPELVAGLLGVLKAGGAYVPLDPEYPADRLAFMVGDAAAPVLLTQRHLAGGLPGTAAAVLLLDDPEVWAGAPDDNPAALAVPDNAAYAIYTSGSTGRPKGVPNTHRAICNRLDWMQRTYGLTAGDAVLQKTPASFDVSVWEFFWPLLAGARLVLARPGGHRDAAYLRDLIAERRVTTAHFVPSMLATFVAEEGIESCRSLRRVICSGEELPAEVARRLLARLPGVELHNLYGPTEAAIDVSAWACTPEALAGAASVPIGRPIQNLRLHVLDRRLEPVPPGVVGELLIGGVGLARGYLGRAGLTAERFVPDPFAGGGSRLYRTGDLARWRRDGALEFRGRADHQVKLRGLRIELGEIEAGLRGRPDVADAVVLVREDGPGDRRLVAYLTGEPDVPALRDALREALPEYMVPSAFVTLPELPLTPNGKLDRRALPAPERQRTTEREFVEPATPAEQTVAGIWRDVLGLERIGADDDFFELGGHSLLATQVVARLRKVRDAGGRPISVMDTFQHRTVRELAALTERPADASEPRPLLHELTRPVPAGARLRTYVCVPFGGGSAVVYQPLADALPAGCSLYSLAIPGHDVGLDEDSLPFDELARRCTDEILRRVEGPLVLYGHCGVGGSLIVEIARRLEAAGRELEAVYTGAIFPFARPPGGILGGLSRLLLKVDDVTSNRGYANWLKSMGVDMDELEPEQADRIIRNMRRDGRGAEEHFTRLFEQRVEPLRAPIITIAGTEDPATEYYQERYREWLFLTGTAGVVVLDQAGHFFLRWRADELAEIVTTAHLAVRAGAAPHRAEGATWWLHGVAHTEAAGPAAPAAPSVRRFLAVAAGQLVSLTGSALTAWAIPVWVYLHTGSLVRFGLLAVVAILPGVLAAPVAGGLIDRTDRRRVMIVASACAAGAEVAMAALLATGHLAAWHVYALVGALSAALAFQRLAYVSAIPQLVPKRFLGHATGVAQLSTGFATLVVPLLAAGLLAAIDLGGILAIDILSYAFAIGVLLLVPFPALLGFRRREPLVKEIRQGFRYAWNHSGLRALLVFSSVFNLFLAPTLILDAPLVLSIGSLANVGQVSFLAALGSVAGGLGVAIWGGPRRRRMLGLMAVTVVLAVFCGLTGARPQLPVVAAGVFGTMLALTMIQAIYTTIVQVKVPQRFHGRVFSINQMITWSTLPIGFGLIGPFGANLLEPLLARGGPLAPTLGVVLGVGPGRGIGLVFVLAGLAMLVLAIVGLRLRVFARFDFDVPDAVPDDLVGARARIAPAGEEVRAA
jgi:amino acid adenylation domain-containing protein